MSQQITIPGPGDLLAEHYRILEELGRGSYGVVFKAAHVETGEVYAIKTLLPQSVLDPEVINRFEREAQLVSRLAHPNVIELHDYGQRDNLFYMVVEYIEGRDLGDVIANDTPMAPDEAQVLIRQILSALEHAHAQGIVHRDLKPANILLRRAEQPGAPEQVKILDFGIAKLVQSETDEFKTLTQAGHVLGTPHYMSPEQISGDEISHRADLYSVGIILYELLVGEHPFEGTTPTAVMVAHLRDDPPPLPAQLERSKWGEAVRAALIKQPDDRIASAAAMLEIIEREEALPLIDDTMDEITSVYNSTPISSLDFQETRQYTPLNTPPPGPAQFERVAERVHEGRAPQRSAPMPSFGATAPSPGATEPATRQWARTPDGRVDGDDFERLQELRDGYHASAQGAAAHTAQDTSRHHTVPLIIGVLVLLALFGTLAVFAFKDPGASTEAPPAVNTAKADTTTTTPRTGEEHSPDEVSDGGDGGEAVGDAATPPTDDASQEDGGSEGREGDTKPDEGGEVEARDGGEDDRAKKRRKPKLPSKITLEITSQPSEADVKINGKLVGKTPLKHRVKRDDERLMITVSRYGFEAGARPVTPDKDRQVRFKLNATRIKIQ